MTRPWRQSGRYGATGSALAATRRRLVAVRPHVSPQGPQLKVGPTSRHRWHVTRDRSNPVLAFVQEGPETLRRDEGRAALDVRAIAARAVERVALRAHAFPLLATEGQGTVS